MKKYFWVWGVKLLLVQMNSNDMFTNGNAFRMTTINPKRPYLFDKRLLSLHAFGYSSNMSSCLLFAAAAEGFKVGRDLLTPCFYL